ncbi:hypothetical protein Molly3_154 [Maribacter phage Molly_3]|uniref:Uncharacterized protein n=1 Tax=Maribacter phage Molly_1 TaxID=2745685 RepID=A0A8E4UY79_9CAUD|nr:hypothetical protein M1M29_gp154 [Maribacter phage Molly_1]QQO97449.1 hypothetical protein Molly1_154 [Maribacter phage Molly_1]QQO97649.1 hypothetical protein Molly2_154 [Maribacter phage Molly_2]QQO97849.1 hypothetical protein Molly3_154 [Maribacter phage Molly_3]
MDTNEIKSMIESTDKVDNIVAVLTEAKIIDLKFKSVKGKEVKARDLKVGDVISDGGKRLTTEVAKVTEINEDKTKYTLELVDTNWTDKLKADLGQKTRLSKGQSEVMSIRPNDSIFVVDNYTK